MMLITLLKRASWSSVGYNVTIAIGRKQAKRKGKDEKMSENAEILCLGWVCNESEYRKKIGYDDQLTIPYPRKLNTQPYLLTQ
jgi:hypothetical protein